MEPGEVLALVRCYGESTVWLWWLRPDGSTFAFGPNPEEDEILATAFVGENE